MRGSSIFSTISFLKEVILRVLPTFSNLQNWYLELFDFISQPSMTIQFSRIVFGPILEFLRITERKICVFSAIEVFDPMKMLFESLTEEEILAFCLIIWLNSLIEKLVRDLLSSLCLGWSSSCLWIVKGERQPVM